MTTYDGYTMHFLYIIQTQGAPADMPSASTKNNHTKRKLPMQWRWALIALAVLFPVGLVITLSVVFTSKPSDKQTTEEDPVIMKPVQLPLFFPYVSGQISNYDTNGTMLIPIPASVKWWILGRKFDEVLSGYVYIDEGFVYLTSDPYRAIIISVSKTNESYDKPDASKGQYFIVSGIESSEAKSLLSCLIPRFQMEVAFVYTWINFTLNGRPVGDFQIVLAFGAESECYVIRVYSTDVIDLEKPQFVVWEENVAYEANLTASDVRETRQVYALSRNPTLGHLEVISPTDVCTV